MDEVCLPPTANPIKGTIVAVPNPLDKKARGSYIMCRKSQFLANLSGVDFPGGFAKSLKALPSKGFTSWGGAVGNLSIAWNGLSPTGLPKLAGKLTLGGGPGSRSFKSMNPAIGIETRPGNLEEKANEGDFQINESRDRDWNIAEINAILGDRQCFQINESRDRDWNPSLFLLYTVFAQLSNQWIPRSGLKHSGISHNHENGRTFKSMNPAIGIETFHGIPWFFALILFQINESRDRDWNLKPTRKSRSFQCLSNQWIPRSGLKPIIYL